MSSPEAFTYTTLRAQRAELDRAIHSALMDCSDVDAMDALEAARAKLGGIECDIGDAEEAIRRAARDAEDPEEESRPRSFARDGVAVRTGS